MQNWAYVRKAKVGELPDGEYPFNVIRVHDEDKGLFVDHILTQEDFDGQPELAASGLKVGDKVGAGYEETTHEDWLTNGGVPEGFEEKEKAEESAADNQ